MSVTLDEARALNAALPFELRASLNRRHISDEIIEKAIIGYGDLLGDLWLTFPVLDREGKLLFLKLKRPPSAPDTQPKGKVFPSGSDATLYPLHLLTPENSTELVVCEGEPDCLALWSHGIPALTSTAGAGTFQEEWLEVFPVGGRVITCFDADDAGRAGEEKFVELVRRLRPDLKVGKVDFAACGKNWGKDVTDYFINPLLWPKKDLPPELPQNA